MRRKDFDTSHSRPYKATSPGTPPNTNVKRNLRKKAWYSDVLIAKRLEKSLRRMLRNVA